MSSVAPAQFRMRRTDGGRYVLAAPVEPVWLRSAAAEDAAWARAAAELGLTLAEFDKWCDASREEKRAAGERVTA